MKAVRMLSASAAAARESAGTAPCVVSATTGSGGVSAAESIGAPTESRPTPSESGSAACSESAAAASAAAPANVDVGGVTVTATIAVTENVDVAELVDRLGGDLAVVIDRRLSELQTREDRALGDTGRVA